MAKIKTLNDRQKRFVEEYLKDFNKTQAAIRAGYSSKSARAAGREVYANPYVLAEIKARKKQMAQKLEIDENRLLRELDAIASENMADFIEYGGDGTTVTGFKKITRRLGRCVQSVTIIENLQGGKRTTIKLWDKNRALDMLAKIKGLYDEEDEDEGKKDAPPFKVLVIGKKPANGSNEVNGTDSG